MRRLAAILLFSCLATAQQGLPAASTAKVNFAFTVTDDQGQPVPGVQLSEVLVRDGRKAVEVLSVEQRWDAPLRIVYVLDTSGSIRSSPGTIPGAIIGVKVLQQFLRRRVDGAALVTFGSDAYLHHDFSDDVSAWESTLAAQEPRAGSKVLDAVTSASEHVLLQRLGAPRARLAIILLSDGEDNESKSTLSTTLADAQKNGVVIYGIHLNIWPGAGTKGRKMLEKLAEDSGGLVFKPKKSGDFATIMKNILNHLRSGYVVQYQPADYREDGGFRPVRVEIRTKRKARVHAPAGYYTPWTQGTQKAAN